MFFFRRPTFTELNEYLWQYSDTAFTYNAVGGTRGPIPEGFSCGHYRVKLGRGRQTFLRAKQSLQNWQMYPADFVDLVWPVPFEPGRVVATLFRAPGLWTLNPCRIVYVIDDIVEDAGLVGSARRAECQPSGDLVLSHPVRQTRRTSAIERFGFAYGTVGDHFASGEERFTVEYDHSDRSVWYEVYCFSKARHWLAKAAYPYLRLQQHRFRRLSGRAMQSAVRDPVEASASIAV